MRNLIVESIFSKLQHATADCFFEDGTYLSTLYNNYKPDDDIMSKFDLLSNLVAIMSWGKTSVIDYDMYLKSSEEALVRRPLSEEALSFVMTVCGDFPKWYFLTIPDIISENVVTIRNPKPKNNYYEEDEYSKIATMRVVFDVPDSESVDYKLYNKLRREAHISKKMCCFI